MEKGREFQKKVFIDYGEASDCIDHKKTCGKFLKRWENQTTYLSSEKPVRRLRSNRIKHETTDWFKIGKRARQDCVLSLFFSLYADHIMWNAELDESWAGIKTVRKNINNLRYASDTTLMAESEDKQKEPLDESERGEWKSWLEIQHSKKLRSWHLVPSLQGK